MEFKPLENKSRIEVVDALRGVALLGILLANIPFADDNLITGKFDSLMIFINHFLIDKKFITIFSILFGFGFYIQTKRAEEKHVDFAKYFTFRMLLLFAIGSLHTFIIWNGDILRAYAFGGILLIAVRKWSVKQLLFTAILFNVFLTAILYIGNTVFGWQNYTYDYALAQELPLTTSYFRYLVINATMDPWVNFLKDMPITLAFTFGNMIIGLILAKVDFFHLPAKLNKLTTLLIIQGLTLGMASSFIYYKITVGEINFDDSLVWLPFLLVTGMIFQSLMYISLFVRLYQSKGFKRMAYSFTLIGKTALSNYIFQSVLFLVVFFHCGHTLQLFGRLTIAQTFMVATIFFLLQIALSYFWLRKYTQGPLEFIWKKLSYGMAKTKNKHAIRELEKSRTSGNT